MNSMGLLSFDGLGPIYPMGLPSRKLLFCTGGGGGVGNELAEPQTGYETEMPS